MICIERTPCELGSSLLFHWWLEADFLSSYCEVFKALLSPLSILSRRRSRERSYLFMTATGITTSKGERKASQRFLNRSRQLNCLISSELKLLNNIVNWIIISLFFVIFRPKLRCNLQVHYYVYCNTFNLEDVFVICNIVFDTNQIFCT